jgi:hypothetical protein
MQGRLRLMAAAALTASALLAPAGSAVAEPAVAEPAVAGPAVAGPAGPARQTDTSFSFALVTPNTALAPTAGTMAGAGDRIRVTGGGWFDPRTGTVYAGGTFTHLKADGTVHCRGVWKATALTGWTDFGTVRGHRHGGVASLVVTHECVTMGMVHTGIPMTVTSDLNAPAGSSYTTGVTVGDFTVAIGGRVWISGHHDPADVTSAAASTKAAPAPATPAPAVG